MSDVCVNEVEAKGLAITGLVKEKFLDSANHNFPTIIIQQDGDKKKLLFV